MRIRKHQAEGSQDGRSLLSNCGSYAPAFLNDVYKKGTQARKCQAEGAQDGRSMVEMLGVLAIIGVLSIGAIAGYSKAMFKYRLNKHAQQINTLMATISRYYRDFENLPASTSIMSYFIKMNEIPTEMIKKNETRLVYDTFNMAWQIFCNSTHTGIYMSSYSTSAGSASVLLTRSTENFEICKNIILTAKEYRANLEHLVAYSTDSGSAKNIHMYFGDAYCISSRKCLKNITLDEIHKICTDHLSERSVFEMFWAF